MAKEFEHYNDKYRHLQRTDTMELPEVQIVAEKVTKWEALVASWIQADVQHAVYKAPDHEEWQKFRVSLKGQSTRMKLTRLAMYRADALIRHHPQSVQLKLERCRIDNYIGALVHGGQLNSKLEIVR